MSESTKPTVTHRGQKTANQPAAGVPYYTPAQTPPAGTALATAKDVPTLFTPLTIRDVTLANRFVVSPMCMYSADEGHLTDFHLVHLGQLAQRGAALTIIEATAVLANGRISPEDSGLWQDSQIAPVRRIADFVHSQGHKIGIQLAHAGRKASTYAPWLDKGAERQIVPAEEGGWPDNQWAPSAIPWAPDHSSPNAITVAQIKDLVQAFADAAKRAIQAGIDVIEIHGAHGYLISEFLSPLSNKRTDDYGGSFENRSRVVREVIAAVRAVIPKGTPLFLRLSATEWMEKVTSEPSWAIDETTRLALELHELGVDLLDVSSGGNSYDQKIEISKTFQTDLALHIRKAVQAAGKKLLIGSVGMVDSGSFARDIVQVGGKYEIDLVLVARQFLRQPEFVLHAAHELGVPIKLPNQYSRAPYRT